MPDDIKETKLRLPVSLHERLKHAAERDHRSMHAQVLAYVERGIAQDEAKERRARER